MQEKIKKLKILLDNSNNILLINHVRMDPDAF
jgi:nanoRNase/pAp phosphatase (c-di-AMP/oligoRNAs hydrolase)